MLGFILSKLNLLVLAVSMLAIILFFSKGLSDISVLNNCSLIINQIISIAASTSNSKSSCHYSYYYLPNKIGVGNNGFYYILKISVVRRSSLNQVIFSILPRNVRNANPIVANSFITDANVIFYYYDYDSQNKKYIDPSASMRCDSSSCNGSLASNVYDVNMYLDPQAAVPINNITFIKQNFINTTSNTLEKRFYIISVNNNTNLSDIENGEGMKCATPI